MNKLFEISTHPRVSGTEALYFRNDGDKLSFDTYFNMIPIRKLKTYTTISKLTFSQPAEIHTESQLLKYGDSITLGEIPNSAELLYLRSKCDEGSITVYATGKTQIIKPVLIICTYQREQQVMENIDYLLDNGVCCEIILVDNASSIPIDTWGDKITVLHNINNGGSGGYAYGMQYVAAQKCYTHMILMDDDVIVDNIAIRKMLGFLSFLKNEYADISIAGSMLFLNEPTIQFECGGYFSIDGQQTGYGYRLDLTEKAALIENEMDKNINYGGWWFMCMPIKYAVDGQLPAPFFIKYDDVEYALRCKLNIITLNGVGVWHEDFGSKYNSVQEYFNTRNYLFLRKRHTPNFSKKTTYKTARYLLLEKLCRQQYNMAEAVLIAYEDYLKGEEVLTRIDYNQKLANLKKLNYEMQSDAELFQNYGIRFDEELYSKCITRRFKRYMQPLLYGHLLPRLLCRNLTITDVLADQKEHYFGADMTLHYSRSGKCGYVTRKSIDSFITLLYKLRNIEKVF